MFGFHIIRQYEQGVVSVGASFQTKVRQPGLIWLEPLQPPPDDRQYANRRHRRPRSGASPTTT